MSRILLGVLWILAFSASPGWASDASIRANPALSLSDVILRAERFSPNLKAAEQSELSARQSLRISQSLYYPTLDVTAVDSTGFPASSSAPAGFNGVMGSPYRVGLSGGAYSTFTFFDLTREYRAKAASLRHPGEPRGNQGSQARG